ncbi:helix-turn-helix domain-containing protein [Thermoactinospora rubra]|uniref:helix-turn-helix domain-containing protein n=1 Tax=Thermoactinospora rubra TaxID=1088767 RepID=UPI001981BBE1|nr:helix-turn-helix transcriptional regulator [Thermoactinospora rubra]
MANIRQAREALGARLRELRKDAGLNGKQLAQRLGWIATKISKIELGKQTPTEADLQQWARACDAADQLPSLLAQLRSLELAYAAWHRQLRAGTRDRQRQIAAIEAETELLRVFEPATVPGLLQTREYARHLFAQAIAVHGVLDDLEAGVQARMERQEILYRPGHRFHFVLCESALRNLMCPPEVMMGQIERLVASATLPNVALGVIPWTARLPKTPVHGFWLYGEQLVTVETFAAELSLIQPEEIALYGKIFDLMHKTAVYGKQARALMTRVLDDLATTFFPEDEQQPGP